MTLSQEKLKKHYQNWPELSVSPEKVSQFLYVLRRTKIEFLVWEIKKRALRLCDGIAWKRSTKIKIVIDRGVKPIKNIRITCVTMETATYKRKSLIYRNYWPMHSTLSNQLRQPISKTGTWAISDLKSDESVEGEGGRGRG